MSARGATATRGASASSARTPVSIPSATGRRRTRWAATWTVWTRKTRCPKSCSTISTRPTTMCWPP
jgi:hypothetical protein